MKTLEIRFTNDTKFKHICNILVEEDFDQIDFIEIDDGVNPEVAFTIANLIKTYSDKYRLTYTTFRTEFPELSPDILFRGIPFDDMYFNDVLYIRNPYTGKLQKVK